VENLLGGLAGLVTGAVGAFVAGIFHITAKRVRNGRLIRRDEPPVRDVMFTPFWVLFGLIGFIAGICWTWRLDGTWLTGAVAGCGAPALLTLICIIWMIVSLVRR
jgi:hypothetical protein